MRAIFDGPGGPLEGIQSRHKPAGALTTCQPRAGQNAVGFARHRAPIFLDPLDRDPLYPLEVFVDQYRAIPGSALYVIPNGGHDAIFRAARPDFVRSALAFLAV